MSRKWIWAIIPVLIWAGIIAWLSTGSSVQLPDPWKTIHWKDKIGHAVAYFVLAVLLCRVLHYLGKLGSRSACVVVVLSSFYGAGMEAIQYFFYPGRHFELLDMVANVIGASLGVYVAYYFLK